MHRILLILVAHFGLSVTEICDVWPGAHRSDRGRALKMRQVRRVLSGRRRLQVEELAAIGSLFVARPSVGDSLPARIARLNPADRQLWTFIRQGWGWGL